MEAPKLTPERKAALLGLLDDTEPAVRKGLLAHFQELDRTALGFLKEVVAGNNRILAWHARWFLEELKFTDPIAEFRGFIRSLNYELETGALLLARTVSPPFDVGSCCQQFDEMAQRCRELFTEPMTTREKCRVINRVLFHEHGFRGNREHYTDPLNSLLDQVLARRKGLPLTLSVVYLLVAQRLGMSLEPVGLPGHFVVGCFVEEPPFFVDPFEQGAFRTPQDLYALIRANGMVPRESDIAPTPLREVLCRCCRNLANHFQSAGDEKNARLFADFVEEFEATYERNVQP